MSKQPILPPERDPMLARAVLLEQDGKVSSNPIARVFPEDLVVEDDLSAEGKATFFTSAKKNGEWGSFSKDRDVLAVTLLAQQGATRWTPVVGARIVIRLRGPEGKSFVVLDACTRGDGTTILLPGRVFPKPTPLGQLLHCPIAKGDDFNLEVVVPGHAGERVRVVLHTMRADVV